MKNSFKGKPGDTLDLIMYRYEEYQMPDEVMEFILL